MNFKKFFSITICVCTIVYSSMFGMYRVPVSVTHAVVQPAMQAVRQAAGYGQGVTSEQLLSMPQPKISSEQVRQMQEELMQEYQPEKRPVWSTYQVRPPVYVEPRAYQAPTETLLPQPEQKSLKKEFRDLTAGPSSAFSGIRRFGSTDASRATTMASAEMRTPQRFLVTGQENDPMWVQANKDVEDFRKLHKIPALTPSEIHAIKQKQDEDLKKVIMAFPPVDDAATQQRKVLMKREINILLKKHGIDPKKVPIYFISPEVRSILKLNGNYAVSGNSILVGNEALYDSQDRINMVIEHEISHLIHNDAAYEHAVKEAGLNEIMQWYHTLLIEKRADTHSSIQSKKNVLEMSKDFRYPDELKALRLVGDIVRIAPGLMNNPEFIKIISKKYRFGQLELEKIKQFAIQEYKERKISAQALQEIIKMCDKPTYVQDLLEYMTEQENHPSCIISL